MSLIRARYRAVNTIMNLPRGGYVGLLDLFPNAAAAYSLRKLRAAYSGAAVRVRRSSDNTEQDIGFDANGDLDTTALTTFVNSGEVFTNADISSATGWTIGGNTTYNASTEAFDLVSENGLTVRQERNVNGHTFAITIVLDSVTSGGIKIYAGGTQSAVISTAGTHTLNIVGGSSNTILGINPNGTVTCSISSFSAIDTTANGFVTVWYDQSLSNNATQTTAANQPKIVSAGSLVTENGKAAIDFDGVDDIFAANALAGLSRLDLFFAAQTTDTQYVHFSGVSSLTTRGFTAQAINLSSGLTANMGTPTMYNNGVQFTGTTRDDVYVAQDGYQVISYINANTTAFSDFGIGGAGSFVFSGKFQELIGYPSNQSANRTGIEGSINEYYNIY